MNSRGRPARRNPGGPLVFLAPSQATASNLYLSSTSPFDQALAVTPLAFDQPHRFAFTVLQLAAGIPNGYSDDRNRGSSGECRFKASECTNEGEGTMFVFRILSAALLAACVTMSSAQAQLAPKRIVPVAGEGTMDNQA